VSAPARLFQAAIRDVRFGERVTVVEPGNLYECAIGDDCFVGPFVEIQRGVAIGARTRVQSHAFICELVTIGADCFIGHGVMFVNDKFAQGGPARGRHQPVG
jgi:UDP-3-O-[3-hydroxymyristoyl] glucosamine N-acyltransferase